MSKLNILARQALMSQKTLRVSFSKGQTNLLSSVAVLRCETYAGNATEHIINIRLHKRHWLTKKVMQWFRCYSAGRTRTQTARGSKTEVRWMRENPQIAIVCRNEARVGRKQRPTAASFTLSRLARSTQLNSTSFSDCAQRRTIQQSPSNIHDVRRRRRRRRWCRALAQRTISFYAPRSVAIAKFRRAGALARATRAHTHTHRRVKVGPPHKVV